MWGRNTVINPEDNTAIIYSNSKNEREMITEMIAENLLIGKSLKEMQNRYGNEYMFNITVKDVRCSDHEKEALAQWLLKSDLWDYEVVRGSKKTISDYVDELFKEFLTSPEYEAAQRANDEDESRAHHSKEVFKFASRLKEIREMQLRQIANS